MLLHPAQIGIKWQNDLDHVEWRIAESGLSREEWALTVDLSRPIKVYADLNVDDGHHRWLAASILGVAIEVEVE